MGRIVKDYTDQSGIRCIEDDRGNYHFFLPNQGEYQVHVDVTPTSDDSEKQRYIRITEALRSENNWLWGVITTAIIDRKKSGGAPKALDELEQKVKERQRA